MRRGRGMREAGSVATVVGMVLVMAACGKPPEVTILTPAEGETMAGPAARVTLAASGIEIAPAAEERAGTAHHHLFLDRDATPATDTIPAGVTGIIHLGRAQTEFTFDSLPPGPHRVIAVLANYGHVPIPGARTDTVNFVVGPAQ